MNIIKSNIILDGGECYGRNIIEKCKLRTKSLKEARRRKIGRI